MVTIHGHHCSKQEQNTQDSLGTFMYHIPYNVQSCCSEVGLYEGLLSQSLSCSCLILLADSCTHAALQDSTMRSVSEVVWAAAHGKGVPVPNRACKLTRYLQDTLCSSGQALHNVM